jgi:ABC-2 type transport system permease protein
MKNSWLIALREFKERLGSRSFVILSLLGPVLILGLLFTLFKYGGEGKQHWTVLIADPTGIMENKILLSEDKSVTYYFSDGYIEMEEFRDAKQFARFDALIEINEKVLANKTTFIFYRHKPSVRMQIMLQFHVERRLEEVMATRFTNLTLKQFRNIKQPLLVAFRNVYDPHDRASDMRGWVGFFFGGIIFLFILFFGMTILRSVLREKSNRIVEVLVATVNPNQLMIGKIIGIGMVAFLQFICWIIMIGLGLFIMRESLFPSVFDASIADITQMTREVSNQMNTDSFYSAIEYNEFVNLVFERIQFGNMLSVFLLFFIGGYLFYGALFAAIGATSGSESDGQQFVIPVVMLLILACYAGYYSLQNPDGTFVTLFHYLPFTSPVAVLVRLAQGYEPGHIYELFLSLFILIVSTIFTIIFAGRLYKNGILHFGHRISLSLLFRWMKKM